MSGLPKGLGERRRDRGDVRRGRGEGEEGKEGLTQIHSANRVTHPKSLPPFFASLLPLFPLGTPDTQASTSLVNEPGKCGETIAVVYGGTDYSLTIQKKD